jgi:hypothetical protein
MKSVTINNTKYFFKKLIWNDITGDSTIQSETEFNNMKCAEIITEAYIYDVFEEDGREYVRTFASYSIKNNEYGYGDRNCYPIEVFDKSSQKAIREAHRHTLKG